MGFATAAVAIVAVVATAVVAIVVVATLAVRMLAVVGIQGCIHLAFDCVVGSCGWQRAEQNLNRLVDWVHARRYTVDAASVAVAAIVAAVELATWLVAGLVVGPATLPVAVE